MEKIILLGYMGSGKTTVAKLLAEKLQIPSYDLDEIIEKNEKTSVSDIFKTKGEIHFRKLEHLAFKKELDSTETFVLGLGGGTPCYANNHELLNGNGIISIYLKASIKTIIDRLEAANDRPLLSGMHREEKQEFIAKHLFDRSYYYNQAKYTVTVDGKSPEEIVVEIQSLLA